MAVIYHFYLFYILLIIYTLFLNLPIKTGAFPDEIDDEITTAFRGSARTVFQLDTNIFTEVVRDFDDVTDAGPWFVHLANIAQTKFVTVHQLHVAVGFRQGEIGDSFLVQTDIPTNVDVLLCLRLFQTLVVIGLKFHQWTEYVLVLVAIFVPQQNLE